MKILTQAWTKHNNKILNKKKPSDAELRNTLLEKVNDLIKTK